LHAERGGKAVRCVELAERALDRHFQTTAVLSSTSFAESVSSSPARDPKRASSGEQPQRSRLAILRAQPSLTIG